MSNKFTALSIGSVTKLPSFNNISYKELYDAYYEQVIEADVDIYLIETSQDII